jgi:hypothetical protein
MIRNVCTLFSLAILAFGAQAQLSSTDPAISDGTCNFPSKVALNTKVLDVSTTFPLQNDSKI